MAHTTNVSTVVQDGSGTVWGLSLSSGPLSQLYRWSNGDWSEVPTPAVVANSSPEAEGQANMNGRIPRPIGLWNGPDGGVLTIWLKSSSTDDSELVWQRGNEAKILASLPGFKQQDRVFPMDVTNAAVAAKGIVLITGEVGDGFRNGVRVSGPAPGLFRVGAHGQVQRIYTFSPSQYLRYRVIRVGSNIIRPINVLPLHTTRDAQGKVWIWCGWTWPPGPPGAAFAGFLVTNGKTAEYHRRILKMNFLHLTTLGVWDKDHLAAGTFGSGLYTINTTTLVARHVPEPQPGAFFYPRKVFSMGKDHYVLTLGPTPRVRLRPELEALLTDALWRFHNGQWKEVLANIGNSSGPTARRSRFARYDHDLIVVLKLPPQVANAGNASAAGLPTPRGFWLARSGHGLIFVSLNHSPRSVDWRQGLPLANVSQLFRLSDGNVLAYSRGFESRTVEIRPAAVLSRKPPRRRFSMLRFLSVLRRQPQRLQLSVMHSLTNIEPGLHHNLWGLLPSRVLGQWDGSRWIEHPLPEGFDPSHIIGLDIDTRGRVWLFPDCYLGPMGFYNPVDNRWSLYRTYMEALSKRSRHVTFLHPADDKVRPIYGPNSQIVFVGLCNAVNYFNGVSWRSLLARSVPGGRIFGAPPFFDAAGHVALDIMNTTWQWTPQTGWQNTGGRPPAQYIPLMPNPFAAPLPPPAGCESPPPNALVKDSFGRSWWVAHDALYEGVQGDCRMVLSASAHQPFIDGRKLVAAKIGPRGNAFLETTGPSSYIMLPRKLFGGKPPDARTK